MYKMQLLILIFALIMVVSCLFYDSDLCILCSYGCHAFAINRAGHTDAVKRIFSTQTT